MLNGLISRSILAHLLGKLRLECEGGLPPSFFVLIYNVTLYLSYENLSRQ